MTQSAGYIPGMPSKKAASRRLTTREREVVRLLAQGYQQTEIARRLCISQRTAEAHVRNAREKTGTASAFQLAVKVAAGEIDTGD